MVKCDFPDVIVTNQIELFPFYEEWIKWNICCLTLGKQVPMEFIPPGWCFVSWNKNITWIPLYSMFWISLTALWDSKWNRVIRLGRSVNNTKVNIENRLLLFTFKDLAMYSQERHYFLLVHLVARIKTRAAQELSSK